MQHAHSTSSVFKLALVATAWLAAVQPAFAGDTLNRVKASGKMTLGYADARPFSYRDEAGAPAGYAVELCKKIVDQVKAEPGLGKLSVEWVPVSADTALGAIQQGKIDLLCTGTSMTLQGRREVSYSLPVFPGGIGAMLRADSSPALRELLSNGRRSGPYWRGAPAQVLNQQTFSAVSNTMAARWLNQSIDKFQLTAKVNPIAGFDAGVQSLLDHKTDVLFADHAILVDAAKRSASSRDLVVLDRLFTHQPLALAFKRGDDDLSMLIDQALSRFYASKDLPDLYAKWFGPLQGSARDFFQWSALPE